MSMRDGELELVKAEAERVLADVKAVMANRKDAEKKAAARLRETVGEPYAWGTTPSSYHDSKLTAALRRHSMDLTRALARLRSAA